MILDVFGQPKKMAVNNNDFDRKRNQANKKPYFSNENQTKWYLVSMMIIIVGGGKWWWSTVRLCNVSNRKI